MNKAILKERKSIMNAIRAAFFLVVVLFVVLAGDLLYTVEEVSYVLEEGRVSQPLSEGVVISQDLQVRYPQMTNMAVAIERPEKNVQGFLTFALYEKAGSELIYEETVSLDGVTDRWYIDFTIDKCFSTDKIYCLNLSASGYNGVTAPGVYLLEDGSVALRQTYKVLSFVRIIALVTALCMISLVLWVTRKVNFRELLSYPIGKKGCQLIHILMFLAVTAGAIVVYAAWFPTESNDYYIALGPWIEEIRENGVIASLGKDIGDYTPIYMIPFTLLCALPFEPLVIIKLFSCIFNFVMAIAGLLLASTLGEHRIEQKILLYALLLLNPITVLNAAAWGQCDAMYTAFCILALYGIGCNFSNKKHWYATGDGICFLCAIAFCFKLQAVFLLPVLGLLLVKQKTNLIKLIHFFWIPVMYIISCIPMFLAGRSFKNMISLYLGQAGRKYGSLTMNYPNLYSLIGSGSESAYQGYFYFGLLMAFFILLFLIYRVYCSKVELSVMLLCKFAIISVLVVCFFMPYIHERYAFLAEMLLLIVMVQEVKYVKVAIPTLLCTMLNYCTYLYQIEGVLVTVPEWGIALVRLGCIIYLIYDLMKKDIKQH